MFLVTISVKSKGHRILREVKRGLWLKVKEFTESEDKERIVAFSLPKKDYKKLKAFPEIRDKMITCRLIKVELENGEKEILCTSLTDNEKYQYKDFDFRYHYRWNEEEAYKLLKSRLELENFSGKTARAVKQDFYAKIFLMTLCAAYAHPIEEKVLAEYKADANRKFDQKINRTNALSMTKEIMIAIMIKKQFEKAITAFDQVVEKTREIIRPGRSFPRNKKFKRTYSMNYKPL